MHSWTSAKAIAWSKRPIRSSSTGYLYRRFIANTKELVKLLPVILAEYNDMPLACLNGLTPNEVLAGVVPDRQKWREKLRMARAARLAADQKHFCEDTC